MNLMINVFLRASKRDHTPTYLFSLRLICAESIVFCLSLWDPNFKVTSYELEKKYFLHEIKRFCYCKHCITLSGTLFLVNFLFSKPLKCFPVQNINRISKKLKKQFNRRKQEKKRREQRCLPFFYFCDFFSLCTWVVSLFAALPI